ncbi:MAG: translation initiation factor IF-2 subunit beta [Candidatus Aenigmarchaeota archaeon]|nr:translation initiation factor IF-2 subunit beta [Candidatus Aenigmarchaeota archaeon]
MNYEELLKRAKQNMPQTKTEERFEMPVASVTILKRQTVIKNFADIAKTLRRDPKHIAKYIFRELAIPGSINGIELVLQGKASTSAINQRIHDYIKEFVICRECGKPDTSFSKDDNIITIKCEACGARKTFKG